MKKMTLVMAATALLVLSGCKEKKQSQDIIAPKYEAKAPQAPIRMENKVTTRDVKWLGKDYKVEISRVADDSLAMVQDDMGQKFVDNRYTVRIIRADGSVFFNKQFTKASFSSYIDSDFQKTGILDALTFDEVDGNELEFAVSVSHPQTDEYFPLELSVTNFGDISIKRDSDLDTSGTEEEN